MDFKIHLFSQSVINYLLGPHSDTTVLDVPFTSSPGLNKKSMHSSVISILMAKRDFEK